MGTLAPAPAPPLTEAHVIAKLGIWREHLIEHKHGISNCVLTLTEITRELDRWLGKLLELKPTLRFCVAPEDTCLLCGRDVRGSEPIEPPAAA